MKKIYTVLFLVAMLFNASYATIHYSYVYEDFYFNTRYYDLDLDGDNDFSFAFNSGQSASLVHCEKNSSYYAADGNNKPKAYSDGSALGTYTWINIDGDLSYYMGAQKYLAVKFSDGTNTYYGWFLIDYQSYPKVVSYAWNDVPNQTITMGDMGVTSIGEIDNSNFAFSFIDNTIVFNNTAAYNKVAVYNLQGQTISEIEKPAQGQQYPIQANGIVLVAFYQNGTLVSTTKQYIK